MLLRHAGRPVDGLIPPSVHITAEFVLIMLDGRPYRPSASCRMRSIACEDTATTSYPYPLQVPPPTRQGLIDWRHIRSQSPSVTRRTCDLQRAAGRSRMRAVPCLARFPVAHGTKMNGKAVAQPVPVGDVDCPSCVWVWVCHALASHVPSISNHHLTFLSLFLFRLRSRTRRLSRAISPCPVWLHAARTSVISIIARPVRGRRIGPPWTSASPPGSSIP